MQIVCNMKNTTAYHEAGHALALILLKRKFKYVTIRPDQDSKGQVRYHGNSRKVNTERYFIFNPSDFQRYFKHDFKTIAGMVAEKMYTGRSNNAGAKSDYDIWIDVTLLDLPEKFSLVYQRFLMKYIIEVFSIEDNWKSIQAIASALMKREVLTYHEVIDVIRRKTIEL